MSIAFGSKGTNNGHWRYTWRIWTQCLIVWYC